MTLDILPKIDAVKF